MIAECTQTPEGAEIRVRRAPDGGAVVYAVNGGRRHGELLAAGEDIPAAIRRVGRDVGAYPGTIQRTIAALPATLRVRPLLGEREIVEVTHCPGLAVALGDRHQDYGRALAERAYIRSGHPWIWGDGFDAELDRLTREAWADVAPGWLSGDVAGLHAHSAIYHHLRMVGHRLLTRAETAALSGLRALPEAARAAILGAPAFGFDGYEMPFGRLPALTLGDLLETGGTVVVAVPVEDSWTLRTMGATMTWHTVGSAADVVLAHLGCALPPQVSPDPAPWPLPPEYMPMWRMSPALRRALDAFELTRRSYYSFVGSRPTPETKHDLADSTIARVEDALRAYIGRECNSKNGAEAEAVLTATTGGFSPIGGG